MGSLLIGLRYASVLEIEPSSAFLSVCISSIADWDSRMILARVASAVSILLVRPRTDARVVLSVLRASARVSFVGGSGNSENDIANAVKGAVICQVDVIEGGKEELGVAVCRIKKLIIQTPLSRSQCWSDHGTATGPSLL